VPNLPKIEFRKPNLRTVRLARRYEIEGVVFVEGYEKAVGFTFHSDCFGNLSLEMKSIYQAKFVYDFFRSLFNDYKKEESGLKNGYLLTVDWSMAMEKKEALLSIIEKSMDAYWKEAFKTVLSVYDDERN
jgi:hypothetical protein